MTIIGENMYKGHPCCNCGRTLRYKALPKECVWCVRRRAEKNRLKDPDYNAKRSKYRKENREKVTGYEADSRLRSRGYDIPYIDRRKKTPQERLAAKAASNREKNKQRRTEYLEIKEELGDRCLFCGIKSKNVSVSVLIRDVKKKIERRPTNLIPVCPSCRTSRGNSEQAGFSLLEWYKQRPFYSKAGQARIERLIRESLEELREATK